MDDLVSDIGRNLWQRLNGCRIFMTGGTGYFGRSFLESYLKAKKNYGIEIKLAILSRNPVAFKIQYGNLFDLESVEFHEGDIATFQYPNKSFDHVLHFATPASAAFKADSPLEMFNIIIDGTRRVLEFARESNVKSVLLASSGAIYGRQPPEISHISESYSGSPSSLDVSSAYGEGKRAAELLGTIYSRLYGFQFKIARGFAFVGPHLDPNGTYAIGNFIRDALKKNTIEIKGDGKPFRSYLYSDDLVVWLIKILLDGENGKAYNVGSDKDMTLEELAHFVFKALKKDGKVSIHSKPKEGMLASRYVPSIDLARDELGLKPWTPLDMAIRKTAERYQMLKVIE